MIANKLMEDKVMNIIIGGVISWSSLFLLIRKLLPNRSFEFCNRLVSTCHATLAVILAARSVQDWSCPVCPVASKSSPKQTQALGISTAYLIYDLICCQFDSRPSLDNTIHHLVCIIGAIAGFIYEKGATEMVAAQFITEISSPILHLREFLKELGCKDTDLNLTVEVLFAFIFSIARMIGGPYLTYVTLTADNPLLIKMMASGLQLVSIYWFYKIMRMVRYKLTKPRPLKKPA